MARQIPHYPDGPAFKEFKMLFKLIICREWLLGLVDKLEWELVYDKVGCEVWVRLIVLEVEVVSVIVK